MEGRLSQFWIELERQCQDLHCFEFEFYWEMWGFMWVPWFIDVNKKTLTFTIKDISDEDLKYLCQNGWLELIKVYDKAELKDELDRRTYRIIKRSELTKSISIL